jgi:hypothetical protein
MCDSALLRLFSRFGRLEKVEIKIDRQTGRSRGFGFVIFSDAKEMEAAIANVNGVEITSTGDMAEQFSTHDYKEWLRRSLEIDPADAFDERGDSQSRMVTIIEEASSHLADCIATYPDALDHIEWRDLERMLSVVFRRLGFTVECTRGSKDGGVDLRLGGSYGSFVVQIKHWLSGKRVGGVTLKAIVSIAIREERATGLVLSTSGFTRDAVEVLTTFERRHLRIGGRDEIHALCRTYVNIAGGLIQPVDPHRLAFDHTKPA